MQTVHITSDSSGNVTNMTVTPTSGAVSVGQNSSNEWTITITQAAGSGALTFHLTAAQGSGGNGTISSISFDDTQFTATGLNSTVIVVTDNFTSTGTPSSFSYGLRTGSTKQSIIRVDPQIENETL